MTAPVAETIRVAVVEDIPDLRDQLTALVSGAPGLAHVGTASTGEEALTLLPTTGPDVVLMDIGLPGISGVECVRLLRPLLPRTNFMMLTVMEDHQSVFAALRAGATGYLVKSAAWERVVEAIRELHAGGSPMTSSIARDVIRVLVDAAPNEPEPEARLTIREEEVLRAAAAGQRYKDIAVSMGVSVNTVRTHVYRIYRKLQVANKAEAMRRFGRDADGRR